MTSEFQVKSISAAIEETELKKWSGKQKDILSLLKKGGQG